MNHKEFIDGNYAEAVKGIKEEWLGNDIDDTWYKYVISLPLKLKVTYLVVILHNQIINGGFHQYFANRYGQFAKETISSLIQIGALKKAKLLELAIGIVNVDGDTDTVFREKISRMTNNALFVTDELFDPLEKLDKEYYEDDDDIERRLGNYLKGEETE